LFTRWLNKQLRGIKLNNSCDSSVADCCVIVLIKTRAVSDAEETGVSDELAVVEAVSVSEPSASLTSESMTETVTTAMKSKPTFDELKLMQAFSELKADDDTLSASDSQAPSCRESLSCCIVFAVQTALTA